MVMLLQLFCGILIMDYNYCRNPYQNKVLHRIDQYFQELLIILHRLLIMQPYITEKSQQKQDKTFNCTNSSQGIASAFRKLLHRVSTPIFHNRPQGKSSASTSLANFHNKQLLKKRKASISLFHKRKNCLYVQNAAESAIRQNKTQPIHFQTQNETKMSQQMNESPSRSLRCHTNPKSVICKQNLAQFQLNNKFLITQTCTFKNGFTNKNSKTGYTSSFYKRNQHRQKQQNESNCMFESKIKCGNRQRYFNHSESNKLRFDRWKTEEVKRYGQFQPWEYDKIDQLGFSNK